MEATAQYLDGVKFQIAVRGHLAIADLPLENKGTDAGMSPPEFLLASLASCAGYYALEYLRMRSLPTAGLRVHVSAEKARQPARLGSFSIAVTIPNLEPRHEDGVQRAVKACLIHNTLLHPPAVEIQINATAPSLALTTPGLM
jgi:putative redox protein